MSYRDDLAAAHARIDVLEADLRARSADEAGAELTEQIRRLREQLEAANAKSDLVAAERDRLRAAVSHLEERVASLSPSSQSKDLYVLWEHNRRFARIVAGTAAGVACPICHADGLEVEMRHNLGIGLAVPGNLTTTCASVACPRCLYIALKRTS